MESLWIVWAFELERYHLLVEYLKQSSVSELYFTQPENPSNNLKISLI